MTSFREPSVPSAAANLSRRELLALTALGIVGVPRLAAAAATGQLTYGVHVSLAPTWFDPAEASGIITPFMVLYALHDAMVKPMPGATLTPSLAETVSVSEDGLTYDFVLRSGCKFHNGDPVTAEVPGRGAHQRRDGAPALCRKPARQPCAIRR